MLAFEHHAQQRLGARIADEQPALARNARLDARDGCRDRRHAREIDLLADANVQKHLRVA